MHALKWPINCTGLKLALHNNRAMAFLQNDHAAAGVADASVALQLSPLNPKALFRRGLCYAKLKRWPSAVTDLEQLCNLQPSNSAARRELDLAQAAVHQDAGLRFAPGGGDNKGAAAGSGASVKIHIVEDSDDEEDSDDGDDDKCNNGIAPATRRPSYATFTKEIIKEGSGPSIQDGQSVSVEANLYLAASNTAIWSTHKSSGFLFPGARNNM